MDRPEIASKLLFQNTSERRTVYFWRVISLNFLERGLKNANICLTLARALTGIDTLIYQQNLKRAKSINV